ncbi:MAG TPA: thioredoxin [Methanomassiliicoccales archaeon]|nr:thioredoxin [Methanomassiliicoccales archaeon]
MPENLIEVTDDNFEELRAKYDKLVIDCWAEWCGPCKMIKPAVEELAETYQDSIAFGTLDVDMNPNTSNEMDIMAIPTILYFKDGKLVDETVGVVPKQAIEDVIKQKL